MTWIQRALRPTARASRALDVRSPEEAVSAEVELPDPKLDGEISLERALATRRSVRHYAPGPLSAAEAGQLLWAAQGITDPDGARTAPSAGGLHPLRAYLVAERVAALEPGIYAYLPARHRLRARGQGCRMASLAAATYGQDWIARAAAVLALTADDARTTARYGERGRRYVEIEAGNAVENAHLQATALGLGAVVVGAFDDAAIARVLGCDRRERPLCMLAVGRREAPSGPDAWSRAGTRIA